MGGESARLQLEQESRPAWTTEGDRPQKEQSLSNSFGSAVPVIRIPGEKYEEGPEKVFRELMAEIFQNVAEDTHPHPKQDKSKETQAKMHHRLTPES